MTDAEHANFLAGRDLQRLKLARWRATHPRASGALAKLPLAQGGRRIGRWTGPYVELPPHTDDFVKDATP